MTKIVDIITGEPVDAAPGDAPKTKRTRGRPKWEPSIKERAQAEMMAGLGIAPDEIAQLLGVTAPTLRKHCYMELQRGRVNGKARNTKRLNEAAAKGNVTAMIWLDKTRYGVTEPDAGEGGKKEQLQRLAHEAQKSTKWDGLLQ